MKKIFYYNENGKLSIDLWVSIIGLVLLITSALISIVALTVQAEKNIETNNIHIIECKEDRKDIIKILNNHENRLTKIETHYTHIILQLDRIEKTVGE